MDISVRRLRCLIGWLALLLPWLIVLLVGFFPDSISSTYYTFEAGPVFVIVLGSASFLLSAYKGYELVDDVLNTLAAVFGIMICLFPCWPVYLPQLQSVGTFQIPREISLWIHNISAILFFTVLSINSLFLFTKSKGEKTRNKKIRNIIFIVCGIGMIGSFLLMLIPSFYIQIWLVEAIALFFFGISWLTKANCYPFLFCDKKKSL
jgi:hypothetical protein